MGLEIPTSYVGMSESFASVTEQTESEDALEDNEAIDIESGSSDDPPDNSMYVML